MGINISITLPKDLIPDINEEKITMLFWDRDGDLILFYCDKVVYDTKVGDESTFWHILLKSGYKVHSIKIPDNLIYNFHRKILNEIAHSRFYSWNPSLSEILTRFAQNLDDLTGFTTLNKYTNKGNALLETFIPITTDEIEFLFKEIEESIFAMARDKGIFDIETLAVIFSDGSEVYNLFFGIPNYNIIKKGTLPPVFPIPDLFDTEVGKAAQALLLITNVLFDLSLFPVLDERIEWDMFKIFYVVLRYCLIKNPQLEHRIRSNGLDILCL